MGVAGLWDILRPAGKQRSLVHLSVVDGFQENINGQRGYKIGIDASIWFFHATGWANSPSHGENPELRTLFFRLARMLALPLLPLFVFDGPKRPDFKRGKRVGKNVHWLTRGMQQIIEAYGFEWRTAPGEAEAELAYLNRIGVIDAVLSDDVDNFLFGSTVVIRNPSATLSGNYSHPTKNSAGVDDKMHVTIYRADKIQGELGLTRGGCILVGLMSGGDYHPAGVPGCGPKTAHGLARAGFGDSLFEAFVTLPSHELPAFLEQWGADLRYELATDSHGFLGKKHGALSKKIPETFPDLKVLESYVIPVTSESLGRNVDIDRMWQREADVAKIAQCCEQFFEWGYKEMIIKRFRTFLWGGVCMRVLRRAVMDSDEKEVYIRRRNRDYRDEEGDDIMATPRKTGRRAHELTVGTANGLVRHYFQDMQHISPSKSGRHFGDEHGDEYGGDGKKLLTRITRSREHASTDGLLEYRVEVYPAPLVRLVESGIRGLRPPIQDDLGTDADDDEDDGEGGEGGSKKKGSNKPPPHPEDPLLLWLPSTMLEMAEPGIVEEFEGIEDAKARKKQEVEQRKKDRVEGKVVPRQPKAKKADGRTEGECPTTPTRRKASTATKKKDGQSQAGAIAKAFKATKKKPVTGGNKGKTMNKFVMPSPDDCDFEEDGGDTPTSQKLFTSLDTAAPKPTAKKCMLDEVLDDVITSSLSKAPHRPKSFDAAEENPFLDSIPAPSADKSKGKARAAILAPPKFKSQMPNTHPTPARTARERIQFLFAQNPDYFSPSPSLGADEEGDLLDPYAALASVPLMPTSKRTVSASTKVSGSGSSRTNSTGSASSGAEVLKDWGNMEEDEVESFEDVFAGATPVAKSKRPKPHPKAHENTISNTRPFRFVLPESPAPEPKAENHAPVKPKGKGKEKARPASSCSSATTAEATDGGQGVRKSTRKSAAPDSPPSGKWMEPPRPGAGEVLVAPARKWEGKVVDPIELSDSDGDGVPALMRTLVKPMIKPKATREENARGVSRGKANVADISVIDLDSD